MFLDMPHRKFPSAAFCFLGGKEPNMFGSKRKYRCSSQHIVMTAKNLDSFGIDLRYPMGCFDLSPLFIGMSPGRGVPPGRFRWSLRALFTVMSYNRPAQDTHITNQLSAGEPRHMKLTD